jgi:serine/threonine-protein kinase PpkA
MAASFPTIAGYVIEREIGQGGMARVYLARQLKLDRAVAIKVLHRSAGDSDAALQRFEQEAQLIAQLHHPHIVAIYDVGHCASGELYFVMPYLAGGDLRHRARSMNEAAVIDVLHTVLDALDYAHKHQVIHRDVKPENVLFDADERPMLADFGVALSGQKDSRITTEGHTVGSATYMSPEQARGMAIDQRSDLYSVGIIAFELLTGAPPFRGQHWLDTLLAHQEQAIPRLSQSLVRWQAWIDDALAKNANERFQNAAQMRASLPSKQALVDPTYSSAPVVRPAKRWRYFLLAAVVAVVTVVWFSWSSSQPVDAQKIAQKITQGELLMPAGHSAYDDLNALATQSPDDPQMPALRGAFLAALSAKIDQASQRSDWTFLLSAVAPWQQARHQFGLPESNAIKRSDEKLDAALQAQFLSALRAYERQTSAAALAVTALIAQRTPMLEKLRNAVLTLPENPQEFSDVEGVSLRLVRAPTQSASGFAVTAPINADVYKRAGLAFDQSCGASRTTVQTCITLRQAEDMATWMSRQSGHKYSLPSPSQWTLASKNLGKVATPVDIWTSECHIERITNEISITKRSVGRIRQFFGGKKAPTEVIERCAGQYVVSYDVLANRRIAASNVADTRVGIALVRLIRWPLD